MLEKNAKILIIDDSKISRLILKRILAELGYNNVLEAVDGPDGLSKYADENPDLIFLDIVMPEMTGDEVLANIRGLDEEIPVIMLTSATSDVQVEICRQVGISDFIQKPLTPETGAGIIQASLEKLN